MRRSHRSGLSLCQIKFREDGIGDYCLASSVSIEAGTSMRHARKCDTGNGKHDKARQLIQQKQPPTHDSRQYLVSGIWDFPSGSKVELLVQKLRSTVIHSTPYGSMHRLMKPPVAWSVSLSFDIGASVSVSKWKKTRLRQGGRQNVDSKPRLGTVRAVKKVSNAVTNRGTRRYVRKKQRRGPNRASAVIASRYEILALVTARISELLSAQAETHGISVTTASSFRCLYVCDV